MATSSCAAATGRFTSYGRITAVAGSWFCSRPSGLPTDCEEGLGCPLGDVAREAFGPRQLHDDFALGSPRAIAGCFDMEHCLSESPDKSGTCIPSPLLKRIVLVTPERKVLAAFPT